MNLFGIQEKAKIWILEGTNSGLLDVMVLNPETLSDGYVAYGVNSEDDKKKKDNKTKLQNRSYSHTEREPLSLDLFIDRSEITDVTNLSNLKSLSIGSFLSPNAQSDVEKLKKALLDPSVKLNEYQRPPKCRFQWGKFTYEGYASRLSVKYTYFSSGGEPLRAIVSVTLVPNIEQFQAKKLSSEGHSRKTWTVKSGDRLDQIASAMYLDSSYWRLIADENGIEQPLKFPTDNDLGRVLIIPDLAESKATGRV